ncbi:MAG: hypothetical protein HUJ31_04685 [Pseudomonadales bacterium]|nr:hypothetical protein [Pseudomonadales bacterium]
MSDMLTRGKEQPGWNWWLFTFRWPFYHTRLCWPEFLQGIALASATGLALVPMMMANFGLTFEQAIAVSFVQGFLIGIAPIMFGEPYAPGWVTPALPLVLTFVLTGFDNPTERFQAMAALTLTLTAMVAVLGVTGLGRRFMEWLPGSLKAGIILGAAVASFKRVFVDDAPDYLLAQPITTITACAVCLIFIFSIPFRRLKLRSRPLMVLGSLGLLPGFLVAAVIGPFVGEVEYNVEWGILIPPVNEVWAIASPFAIGWPDMDMYIAALPLAFITYIILFGDIVTAKEITREAEHDRPDEHIRLDTTRTHISVALRNLLAGITTPFFPTQGSVWAGVHVVIVQRWRQGPDRMNSLFSGIHSYYFMGIPFIYFLLPLLTGLQPLMGIALSLTLVLTGFACAYVAMAIAVHPVERGIALMTGMAIALFEPWIGLLVGIASAVVLIGGRDAESMEQRIAGLEREYHVTDATSNHRDTPSDDT